MVSHEEAVRRAWEGLLNKYGAFELERRMSRLESYQAFYNHYTRDGWAHIEEFNPDADWPAKQESIEHAIIVSETLQEVLGLLTPEQRAAVESWLEGFTPQETAEMWGDHSSGRVRWFKYTALRRIGVPVKVSKRRDRRKV